MMLRAAWLVPLLAVGAGPDKPVRFDKPAMARFHMRVHFDELKAVEHMLIDGDLDGAQELAAKLTHPVHDPAMAPWIVQTARVVVAAREVTRAPGLDEALRREARVGEACARCHLATQARPVFIEPAPPPADDGSQPARMERHAWGVERLWEGMVAGDEHHWRLGLDVLAASPLPYSPLTEAPALATRLRELARGALVRTKDPTETLEERTRAYGEMLVTCAACHTRVDARLLPAHRR